MEAPEYDCNGLARSIQHTLDAERERIKKLLTANAYVRGRVQGWRKNAKERIERLSSLYAPGDNSEIEVLRMIVSNCEAIDKILTESME